MTEGGSKEFKEKYFVNNAKNYNYLNSDVIQLPQINEEENFLHFNIALRLFNISEIMIDNLFSVLSAILHLGNIEFTDSNPPELVNTIRCKDSFRYAAKLLGIKEDVLLFSLTHTKITMKFETIEKPLNSTQAKSIRDTFAKSLYQRLFHWVVDIINETTYGGTATKNYIGILDIFGFENFDENNYEQFLINYANEKFQQLQNHYIFDVEQREYINEGIEWDVIKIDDNQNILNLIETPPLSILSLLRESSRFNTTSEVFARKLHKQFESMSIYEVPSLNADSQFTLHHYPGKVTYTVNQWIEKDQDNLPIHICEMIDNNCSNKLISLLFTQEDNDNLNLNNTTISYKFKVQLKELMETIHRTKPLFVRCIKPNTSKSSRLFEDELTLAQLRCTGMLNCIQIRKLGYPVRYKFEEFIARYALLFQTSRFGLLKVSPKKTCKKLIGRILKKKYPNVTKNSIIMGKSKILMKTPVATILDDLRGESLHAYVILLQQWWKMMHYRIDYSTKLNACITIQRVMRMNITRNSFLRKKKSILLLQRVFRCYLAIQHRNKLKQNIIKKQKELEQEKLLKEKEKQKEQEKVQEKEKQKDIIIEKKEEESIPIIEIEEILSKNENLQVENEKIFENGILDTMETLSVPKRRRKNSSPRSKSRSRSRSIRKSKKSIKTIETEEIEIRESSKKLSKRKKKGSRIYTEKDLRSRSENLVKKEPVNVRKSKSTRSLHRGRSKSVKKKRKSDIIENGDKKENPKLPLGITELLIGTSWILNENIDIDSCCLFFEYENFVDVVWQFNNISKDRSTQFLGFPSWLPKEQQIDKEQIRINLALLPQTITTILICLVVFSPSKSWKSVDESVVRIMYTHQDVPSEVVHSDWNEWGRLSATSKKSSDSSAKIFCKLSRVGFEWQVSPLDLNVQARTYKAIIPHLSNILDVSPPVSNITVIVHRAENIVESETRKGFVTKYYAVIQFGTAIISTSTATSSSPVWNSTKCVNGIGSLLTISIFRKKSVLFRIASKLVGTINIAISDIPLDVKESWFILPNGRILLSVIEQKDVK